MSRLSRIGLPLSNVSSTANKRACFCTSRAIAYKYLALAGPPIDSQLLCAARAAVTAVSTSTCSAWHR